MRLATAELKKDRPVNAGAGDAVAKRGAAFHRILEKLSGHSRRRRPDTTAQDAPSGKGPDGVASALQGRRHEGRRLGARPLADLLPPVGSFKASEVLAINLATEEIGKVRSANYEVAGTIELPEFGLTVTRLRVPESVNAISAWAKLYDLLPGGGFALNRIYAPYRLGSGPARQGGGVRSGPSGKGCTAERCFGTQLINWQAALAACARDVRVGIVDTGFDRSHPAFAGVRYEYREFLPDGKAGAPNQHGTGILSLLAGTAGSGTPGLIPHATYIVANAFFADGSGSAISDTAQMLQALHWLKKSGVAIANLSFAGPDDELLHHGVQQLAKAGIVMVAAAGNGGPSAPPSYPAAYKEVIAVTAVDRDLAPYRYASRGDHIDIAAPGVEVWTALPGRREGPQTGTSFAVPYVTAVIAVGFRGAGLQPDDDPLAAKRRALALLHKDVKSLGVRGSDATFGAGLVQAPAVCDPPSQTVAVVARDWRATVHPAPAGAWTSTVRTASGSDVSR